MGAHDISFELPGTASAADVRKAFDARRQGDRSHNGHQEGYSGDFQTVRDVKIHDQVFASYNEAMDYCLDKAEKWDFVVAVRYRVSAEATGWLVAGWGAS